MNQLTMVANETVAMDRIIRLFDSYVTNGA
jgi:hypothetical protein